MCKNIMCSFSDIMKSLRIESGLNQSALGEKLNCQRTRIADLERGKTNPTIEDLIALSETFNISVDYLVGKSSVRSTNEDIKMICECTGLTESSIQWLRANKAIIADIINHMLSNREFKRAIFALWRYKRGLLDTIQTQYRTKEINTETDLEVFSSLAVESGDEYREARYNYFEALELIRDCISDMVSNELKVFESNDTDILNNHNILIKIDDFSQHLHRFIFDPDENNDHIGDD